MEGRCFTAVKTVPLCELGSLFIIWNFLTTQDWTLDRKFIYKTHDREGWLCTIIWRRWMPPLFKPKRPNLLVRANSSLPSGDGLPVGLRLPAYAWSAKAYFPPFPPNIFNGWGLNNAEGLRKSDFFINKAKTDRLLVFCPWATELGLLFNKSDGRTALPTEARDKF